MGNLFGTLGHSKSSEKIAGGHQKGEENQQRMKIEAENIWAFNRVSRSQCIRQPTCILSLSLSIPYHRILFTKTSWKMSDLSMKMDTDDLPVVLPSTTTSGLSIAL